VFRDEYWRRDPLTIARESLEALRATMRRAGVL